jgi:hypothetical protein
MNGNFGFEIWKFLTLYYNNVNTYFCKKIATVMNGILDLKFENFLLFTTTMLLTPTMGSLSASSASSVL